jgi:hypothetical protein
MRTILAATILLLCIFGAAQELEHSPPPSPRLFYDDGEESFSSLVEIESTHTIGHSENSAGAVDASPAAAPSQHQATPATNPEPNIEALPNAKDAATAPAVPLDQLCTALLTSAQDNDLPVPFFANLIWQESRLQDDAVSPTGALGIAQFMPEVALASGLENPFDPLQALSASARLLHALRDQFGNIGLAAAAYNAGTKRVAQWLERRRGLPRETRGYVIDVTGRSVEQWRKRPADDDAVQFVRRLPCRDFPAFAELEQAQRQRATQQHEQRAQTDAPPAHKSKVVGKSQVPAHARRARHAERRHLRARYRSELIRSARGERYRDKREAKMHIGQVGRARHWRA